MRYLIIVLALIMCWPGFSQAQTNPAGTMTILVRDPAGQRLASVELIILYEDDLRGRIEYGRYSTDSRGEVVLEQLAWGTYIIQFVGQAPDGRMIQPVAQQNMGMLDDGSGAGNGFGVYFTEPERLELYVLSTQPGLAEAVPLFDQAVSAEASPKPYDPVLAQAGQGPPPTTYTLQEALQNQPAPALPRKTAGADMRVLLALGIVLLGIGSTVLIGYLKGRRFQERDERSAD